MKNLFSGVRVVDLTRYVSGPHCTMMMGELGAEIIKVEKPREGEDNRKVGPWYQGESLQFDSYNLSKKSVTLNTRDPEGKALLKRLIAVSDIVVQNFRPGVMEKMGLGFEDLKKINPKIILVNISGFGQDGPYKNRLCFDGIAQAMGGLMDSIWMNGGVHCTTGGNLADSLTGIYAFGAAASALFYRQQTGEPVNIDVDMFSSVLSLFSYRLSEYELTGVIHAPLGYGPVANFKTLDGNVRIDAGTWPIFQRIGETIGCEWFLDEQYRDTKTRLKDNERIVSVIQQWISDKTCQEVYEQFAAVGIPVGIINTIDKIYEDEHLNDRRQIVRVSLPSLGMDLPFAGLPFRMEGMENCYSAAPKAGDHTAAVLQDLLGMKSDELAALQEKGVI